MWPDGGPIPATGHDAVTVSGRRTISALMCANWECTNIVPDICVPAGEALRPAA